MPSRRQVVSLYRIGDEDIQEFLAVFQDDPEGEYFHLYRGTEYLIPASHVGADARTWLENQDERYLETETGYMVTFSDHRAIQHMLAHPGYYSGIARNNQLLLLPKKEYLQQWIERDITHEWQHLFAVRGKEYVRTAHVWVRVRTDSHGVTVESFPFLPTPLTAPDESLGTVVYDVQGGQIKGLGWRRDQFGNDPTPLLLCDLFGDGSDASEKQ